MATAQVGFLGGHFIFTTAQAQVNLARKNTGTQEHLCVNGKRRIVDLEVRLLAYKIVK